MFIYPHTAKADAEDTETSESDDDLGHEDVGLMGLSYNSTASDYAAFTLLSEQFEKVRKQGSARWKRLTGTGNTMFSMGPPVERTASDGGSGTL